MADVCHYHRHEAATAVCGVCGNPLCDKCAHREKGAVYCCIHVHSALRGKKRARHADVPASPPRRWIVLAAATVALGLTGLHRLYLGRVVSASFRLCVFVATLLVARHTVWAGGRDGWLLAGRFTFVAAAAALADWVMTTVGLNLLQRMSLIGLLRRGSWRGGAPGRIARPTLVGDRSGPGGGHALPRGGGSWASFFLVGVAMAHVFAATYSDPGGTGPATACFVGLASLCGIFWGRDMLAVLYRNNLTDAEDRLPQ